MRHHSLVSHACDLPFQLACPGCEVVVLLLALVCRGLSYGGSSSVRTGVSVRAVTMDPPLVSLSASSSTISFLMRYLRWIGLSL